jgi:hypothetical protein
LTRLVAVLLGLVAWVTFAIADPADEQVKSRYRQLLPMVQTSRLREDYREIGAIGSRTAGSPGEAATFAYVESALANLGPHSVRRLPFTVTVPDAHSTGSLTVDGRSVSVYPLWPNLVRTSSCNVHGPLLYGGSGSLEDLRGLDVRGAVVVLEMGVGAEWKNAAKLGALAAVFIEPDDLSRANAEAKYSGLPLDFPRFYLPLNQAGAVLSGAQRHAAAHLVCRQDWVTRQSENLIVEFPPSEGVSPSAEPIGLVAYADSMSVVPALAPGAEAISGPAVLIEAARVFSHVPHRRPLRLVLLGAHGVALQGAREYVQAILDHRETPTFLSITLDLCSGSRSIGEYARGWFYDYRNETLDNVRAMARTFRSHADLLAAVEGIDPARLVMTDAANDGDGRTWKNNVPGKFSLDCEPMVAAGLNALTFMTIEDSRDHVDTPMDTLDRVDIANIGRQARTVVVMLNHALNDTSDTSSTSDFRLPLDPPHPSAMSLVGGFGTLAGKVVEYDPQLSFVPDTAVPGSLAVLLPRTKNTMGVRTEYVQKVGSDGRYRLNGVMPMNGYDDVLHFVRLQAYRCEPNSGQIDRAASWGVYGNETYSIEFRLKTAYRESPIVVFRCLPLSVYDLDDPMSLDALIWALVYDARTGSFPQDFGEFDPLFDKRFDADVEDSQAIFLPPGIRYQLLSGGAPGEMRVMLTHSRGMNEQGDGYPLAPRGGTFPALPLNTARDIVALNAARIVRFKKYRILSPGVLDLQRQAETEIRAAVESQKALDWPDYDRHARAAWGYALRAHPIIRGTSNDVVNGVVFYLFLLIPFSYFVERLLVGHQLLTRQLMWSVGIFIGAFLLLRLIHPAFEIVSNPMMIFIGFVMGTLSLIVVSFILSKFEASLRAVRQAQSGVHEVDMKRSTVAMAAFNLGVSNLRRRKARTILTTLTLVVMTFIVLSFTSIVTELQLNETPSDTPARYAGLLVRKPGLEPLEINTARELQNEFSGRATVVRRAVYYGADIGEHGILTLQRADHVAEVRCLVGMDPGELKVLRPQEAILPGGRWFRPGESRVVILPTPLAAALKVDAADVGKATITFAGVPYKVIGLVDPGILRSIIDLDGDGAMPADFSLSNKAQRESASTTEAFRKFIRIDPATVFIVPTNTALGLGADIRSIAVGFGDPRQTRAALENLMPRLRMNLYASVPEPGASGAEMQVRQFSVLEGSKGTGIGLVIVQLLIASIFVLNTMVASVYERTREIGIFSSIGLAPNHIAMLFFAESLVYGILGAVIGYFVAQACAKVIVATNALPGLTLNFSSTSAVLSAGIVMAVVLLSTIYPARKAAQIAAPARNDDVFQSEPEGDTWRLPLPFSIGEAEAGPLVRFLFEWLHAYEEYTIGEFVTSGAAYEEIPGEPPAFALTATAWLAPYDLGVSQTLRLVASPSQVAGVYTLELTLTRLAGDPENWPIVNQRFLANLRRQFLTWRTLKAPDRVRYEEPPARTTATSGPAATLR